jgi:signal transduction histidine kinase
VQSLVDGIIRSLGHQIESRGVRVRAHGLPDIVADKIAMEQIFGNLIDNALKYLDPARPGEIEVTSGTTDSEIVFQVTDNGRGMASEDIPKAFELFRRVGTQDVPGDGLGLSYVRTLARFLEGRIWCESEPGKGTTFSFTIPRGAAASTSAGEQASC